MVQSSNQGPVVLLWDNDGTISDSKNPNDDKFSNVKTILPGVQDLMKHASYNFIISGCKTPESERHDFNPDKVILKFRALMERLPIKMVVFSLHIGGVSCYVLIQNNDNEVIIKKAHEDKRYKTYIGKFKKPDIGMFVVMRDMAKKVFNQTITSFNTIMIGDSWHDEIAAQTFGVPFVIQNKFMNIL